jgi:hypothetical protein
MSAGRWVPSPRQFPAKCAFTGLSSREHGPYLECDMGPGRPYIEPSSRREGRMYWSFVSWRSTVVDPEGPYRIVLEEAVAARTQELEAEVERLKALLAADPVRVALDGIQDKIKLPGHLAAAPAGPRKLPAKKRAAVATPERAERSE